MKLNKDRSKLVRQIGLPALGVAVVACTAAESPDYTVTPNISVDGGVRTGSGGAGTTASTGHGGADNQSSSSGATIDQSSSSVGVGGFGGGLDDDDDDHDGR